MHCCYDNPPPSPPLILSLYLSLSLSLSLVSFKCKCNLKISEFEEHKFYLLFVHCYYDSLSQCFCLSLSQPGLGCKIFPQLCCEHYEFIFPLVPCLSREPSLDLSLSLSLSLSVYVYIYIYIYPIITNS